MKIILKGLAVATIFILTTGCTSTQGVALKEKIIEDYCPSGLEVMIIMERSRFYANDKVVFKCKSGGSYYINVY